VTLQSSAEALDPTTAQEFQDRVVTFPKTALVAPRHDDLPPGRVQA
jgi:hypothetical protein